ncbi:hypothetical protein ABZ312_45140 [Streptomyces sp. NPDC006207]
MARHRVNTPQIGATVDNAWRAAALMHAIIRLRPLPARNALYGAALATAYMDAPTDTTPPTASDPGASDPHRPAD